MIWLNNYRSLRPRSDQFIYEVTLIPWVFFKYLQGAAGFIQCPKFNVIDIKRLL